MIIRILVLFMLAFGAIAALCLNAHTLITITLVMATGATWIALALDIPLPFQKS